jgi:UDP-N-acetylglucosamine transferase subunit ALG13
LERGRRDVFAQIGSGAWVPEFIPFATLLEPWEYRERLAAARINVAHAGMGTILSALQHSKPILVMPRRGVLGETRNDHQIATSRKLLEMGKINVAFESQELFAALDRLDDLTPEAPISPFADNGLTRALKNFIHSRSIHEP